MTNPSLPDSLSNIGPTRKPLKLCIFGAGPGTGNLGVEALGHALMAGILRQCPNTLITVFDNGPGVRSASITMDDQTVNYHRIGIVPTRRFYHRDSLMRIRATGWFGGFGHPAIRAIRDADAVLDVTSGDSFTDLYSHRRFRIVIHEKLLALEQNTPLLLLPQTIGPFESQRFARRAQSVLRRATMVWARDPESYAVLRELLGQDLDPSRHRCGVDLAFALDAREPTQPLPITIERWLHDRAAPLIGMNVSGLLYNNPALGRSRYAVKTDYRNLVHRFLRKMLSHEDVRILLVPHVFTHSGHYEHDPEACAAVVRALGDQANGRIAVVPAGLDCCETKWLIGQCDWFCGTRMHTAIAGLSTNVPTAAIAYSRKTRGVFTTCQQESHVVDPRTQKESDMVEQLISSWATRDNTSRSLHSIMQEVRGQAVAQLNEVIQVCGMPHWNTQPHRMAA